MKQAKKFLVQCDFDGTITEKDISFMLLDAFAKGDWKAILQRYSDGKITVGQFNEQAFGLVAESKKVMLDYIEDKAKLRTGFKDFVELCHNKGFRFVVVSNGLDFYIDRILKDNGLPGVEFHAAETRFHSNGLDVKYIGPDGRIVDTEFKDGYVARFLSEGYKMIYIGNGTSDLSPASNCHHIFATESLLKHCLRIGLNCVPFESFVEISQVMQSW